MATVSERARALVIKMGGMVGTFGDNNVELAYSLPLTAPLGVIEQALLAERRLAMEEAAKIAETYSGGLSGSDYHHALGYMRPWTAPEKIATKLRAAAEKEVGK